MADETVTVRYIVSDVAASVAFYTEVLGFTVLTDATPTFADLGMGHLRLRVSGLASSAGRPLADGSQPAPGGWNRIYVNVTDMDATVAKLNAAGAKLRTEVTSGPSGSALLVEDPSGNMIELLQPKE